MRTPSARKTTVSTCVLWFGFSSGDLKDTGGQEGPFWGAPLETCSLNVTRLLPSVSLGSWLSQNVGGREAVEYVNQICKHIHTYIQYTYIIKGTHPDVSEDVVSQADEYH